MIIEETSPMLTCTKVNEGFQYELELKNPENEKAITKIRIGPYLFKPEYQMRKSLFGMVTGGPESGLWMHKHAPVKWSRLHWELDKSQPDEPCYLVSTGILRPGENGTFKFISLYPPGGLRAGLEVFRGDSHNDYGVTGPNYEEFLAGEHEH